jgi:4'-phosphopantetheinyl transferase
MILGGGGHEEIRGLHLVWVLAEDLPVDTGWLSQREREVLDGFRVEKRRRDWQLGRWAAKLALRGLLGASEKKREILADDSGRPQVHFPDGPDADEEVSLSISHSAGIGFVALRTGSDPIGCDVELIETRSDAFVADYFTEAEREAVERLSGPDRALLATLVWSGKESALKVLGEGLRMDTRTVEVDTETLKMNGAEWSPIAVTGPQDRMFRGQWRVRHGLVWTVLSESN